MGSRRRLSGRHRPDCALVLGSAGALTNDSASTVPFQQFQRRQSADALSLRCVEWRFLLFPSESDSGARLFGDGSGSGAVAINSVDILAVALGRRTCRSIWREASVGDRPADRRRRIRAIGEAGYWRRLLDDVLPGGAYAGAR